ncbi:MAG: hypothetical protein HQK92_09950 [Nitrospirae bacterium]|nr:hypothetical protein [Nitrospirota bacterium]
MTIKHFSGGKWSGDWEEHYQRSLFFKDFWPINTVFIGDWLLPARPPLYNILSAFFMEPAGDSFAYYQLISVLLNSLVFFGAYAILMCFMEETDDYRTCLSVTILTVLFCLNPSIIQNITYPWTKSLTNFFILSSFAFSFLAIRKKENNLHMASYGNMGIALITHYSSGPYLLGLCLIDFSRILKKRLTIKAIVHRGLVLLLIMSSWFSFSLIHYGIKGTVGTNSTVAETSKLSLKDNVEKVYKNIVSSFVPYFIHYRIRWSLVHKIGFLRDYTFFAYQANILFMIGSTAWVAVLWSLISKLRKRFDEDVLIISVLSFILITAIAVHGTYDKYGVAHICLQPVAVLCVTFVAYNMIDYNIFLKIIIIIGVFIDAMFGVFSHFIIQNYGCNNAMPKTSDNQTIFMPNILDGINDKISRGYTFLSDTEYASFIVFVLILSSAFIAYSIYKMYHQMFCTKAG